MKANLTPSPFRHSSHHYILVHHSLPDLLFTMPIHAYNFLTQESIFRRILEILMYNIDSQSDFRDHRTFSTADIKCSEHTLEKGVCILLEMPPPTSATEAYFAAVLFSKTREELQELDKLPDNEAEEKILRSIFYYTLELGHPMFASDSGTYFCGRTPDGNHHNYGDGPRPESEVFIDFLSQHIKDTKI
jgi:hypothetical protein